MRAAPERARSRGPTWVDLLVLTLATVLAVGASAALHLRSAVGRELVARAVEEVVSGAIRGALRIGSVESLSARRAVVRHAILVDGEGRVVAHGERVTLELAPHDLLVGVLRFSRARLERGAVRLYPTPSGLPSLIEALAAADPDPSGTPLEAHVDEVELDAVTVRGELLGLRGIVVEDLRATGRIDATDRVDVTVSSAAARWTHPFPRPIALGAIAARISTDPVRGAEVRAEGQLDGAPPEQATVRLIHRATSASATPALSISISAGRVRAQTLEEVGFPWASPLTGSLAGDADLAFSSTGLTVRARVRSDGGDLVLDADLEEDQTTVRAESRDLALASVLRGAPDLTLAGSAEVVFGEVTRGFRLSVAPFLFGEVAVPAVTASGRLEADRVVLDDVTGTHLGGELRGAGFVRYDGQTALELHANVAALEEDANVRRHAPGLRGAVRGSVRFLYGGAGSPWRLEGRLRSPRLQLDDVEAGGLELHGAARASPRGVSLDVRGLAREVRAAGTSFWRVAADVRGDPGGYRAELRGDLGPEASVAASVLARPTSSGWSVSVPHLEGRLGHAPLRGAVTALRALPEDAIEVEGVELALGDGSISGGGTWSRRGPVALRATLRDVELAHLRPWLPPRHAALRGILTAEGTWRGTAAAPVLAAAFDWHEVEALGLVDVSGRASLGYERGTLTGTVRTRLGAAGEIDLTATGLFDPSLAGLRAVLDSGVYDLRATLDRLDLGALSLPGAPEGRVSGTVRGSGPSFAPTLEASLTCPDLSISGWPALRAEGAVSYDTGVLTARAVATDEHGELAEVEGSLLVDLVALLTAPETTLASLGVLPWRVSARVTPRPAETLPEPVRARLPDVLRDVRLALSMTLQGGSQPVRGDLAAFLAWPAPGPGSACASAFAPRLAVSAALAEGTTTVLAHAFDGSSRIFDARVSAPTPVERWFDEGLPRAPPALDAEITAGAVELSRVPGLCRFARGEASATLSARGLLGASPAIVLAVSAPAVSVRESEPVALTLEASASAEGARAEAEARWPNGERLRGRGEAGVRWDLAGLVPALRTDAPLSLSLDFDDTPLAPVLGAVPGIDDVAGHATGQVEARGTVAALSWSGELAVADGYLELAGLGQQLTEIAALVRFHRNWAELVELRGRDGDGTARVSGGIGFDGIRPTRARLGVSTHDFPVRREGSTFATVTSESTWRAELGEETLDVALHATRLAIRLPEAATRATQPLDAHPEIVVRGRDVAQAREEHPLRVRVRAEAPGAFWVRRTDFAAQVVADLALDYLEPELRVTGHVELRRGHMEFFGKRFEVERGSLRFDGTPGLNPEVNLVATHTLRGSTDTVTAHVGGRLSAPEVDFTSTAATDRAEIIALLVSGQRSLASQGTSREADAAGAEADAASFLVGLTAGLMTLTLRNELGGVVDVAVEAGDELGSYRGRVGVNLDDYIPNALRGIVRGIHLEGQVVTPGLGDTGDETAATDSRFRGGGLIELQFPQSLFGTVNYEPPQNWSVDVTWEP